MSTYGKFVFTALLAGLSVIGLNTAAWADDKEPAKGPEKVSLAEGKFEMTAPEGWVRKQPRTRIVEHEFEAPAADGDNLPGRVTVMGAGGSIEDNIDRWYTQFVQTDGSSTKDKAKTKKLNIAGQDVYVVDVTGTFIDKAPFAGEGVERPNYRMLAAIVSTQQNGRPTGNYFIKFTGPERTVAKYEQGFSKMLDSLGAK